MGNKVKKTKKKTVRRYGGAEKIQLLEKYQKLRNEGSNAIPAAEKVGVPYITLRTWQKDIEVKAKNNKKKKVAPVPARGAQPKKAKPSKQLLSSVTLVLTDGTRVECGSAAAAAQFIKANR